MLTAGYVPLHTGNTGLEPGDLTKFMAVPWHTDYNSCSIHVPSPNPSHNTTLYWSWPAQRPVAVYAAKDVTKDVTNENLGAQRFSVRGEGTGTTDPSQLGVFQDRIDMVKNWQKIGVIIQGTSIDPGDGGPFKANHYLEVKSLLDDSGNEVTPWPIHTTDKIEPTGA